MLTCRGSLILFCKIRCWRCRCSLLDPFRQVVDLHTLGGPGPGLKGCDISHKWPLGVAMLLVGALYFLLPGVGRIVLPKWQEFGEHLFCFLRPKTMTARDIIRFCMVFSSRKSGKTVSMFLGDFNLHREPGESVTLQWRESTKKPMEKIFEVADLRRLSWLNVS